MWNARNFLFLVLSTSLAPPLLAGCGKVGAPRGRVVCEGYELDDLCIGAVQSQLCTDSTCVEQVSCDGVRVVSPSESLSEITSQAPPGSCLALVDGTYDAIKLPAGVSLLGRGFAHTSIRGVTVVGSNDTNLPASVLRGFSVPEGGVLVLEARVSISEIEVLSAYEMTSDNNVVRAGVAVGSKAVVTIADSTVRDLDGFGILNTDGSSLEIARTAVVRTSNVGLWEQCTAGCECDRPVDGSIQDVLVEETGGGFVALGATLSVSHLRVHETHAVTGMFAGGLTAFGLVVASCSSLSGDRIENSDNVYTGMFVDSSSVSLLGGTTDEPTLRLANNTTGGLVVQDLDTLRGEHVQIEGFDISESGIVGISIRGPGSLIELSHGTVSKTVLTTLPTHDSSFESGDGLDWSEGASLAISDVAFSSNGRVNILLDGEAGTSSKLDHVTAVEGGTQGNAVVEGTHEIPDGLQSLAPTFVSSGALDVWNTTL